MKCPLCATQSEDSAIECPSCGALFAKLRERQEREKKKAAEALAALAAPAPVKLNPWTGRAVAAGVVVLWILGLASYYRAKLPRVAKRGARPPLESSSVMVRDPESGDLRRVEIRRTPSAARRAEPPPEPPPLDEVKRPDGAPPHDPDFDD